ncbi:MAG TPA: hypothetical protein VF062_22580 [Candidatus Limnocylindrales bacterium]
MFQRKDRTEEQRLAIAEFWRWWESARGDLDKAIRAGAPQPFVGVISEHVNAIHRELEWELTPGLAAHHGLIVTAAGRPELRATAARWLAAAPAPDETWEYHSVRRADPTVFESVIAFGDIKLEVDKVRYAFTVDDDRGHVDVMCYHPSFADVPEDLQAQVTYLTLDWLLGEDRVEIWVGPIHWSAAAPAVPKTPEELRGAVDALAERGDRWAVMEGTGKDGLHRTALVNLPLRSARWPRFDTHLAVALPYRGDDEHKLPSDGSMQGMEAFEDALEQAVGGDGAVVAHETGGMLRTIHVYVDAHTGARARVEAALPGWTEGKAKLSATYDPGFERVGHLAG